MEFVIPVIILVVFCIYAMTRYTGGGFYISKYSESTLNVLLFILPVLQTLVCHLIANSIHSHRHYYTTESIILIIAPLVALLLSVVLLRERKLPDAVFTLCTLAISAWLAYQTYESSFSADFWSDLLLGSSYRRFWGCLGIAFIIVLQILYIHWLKCFYGGSGAGTVRKEVHIFDVGEKPQSSVHQEETTGIARKKEDLYELKKLLDSGLLTQEEFDAEKKKILS